MVGSDFRLFNYRDLEYGMALTSEVQVTESGSIAVK